MDTGWRRLMGSLIFIGHFSQKRPMFSGFLVKNDLQLRGSYESPPSCRYRYIDGWLDPYVCIDIYILKNIYIYIYKHVYRCRYRCMNGWINLYKYIYLYICTYV